MFFANHVLMVEGTAEQALINKMIGEGKNRFSDCGLYVLDSLGKYNIHRFMNLLGALGIAYSVLHDDDLAEQEHKDLNELIPQTRHKDVTLNVTTIPGNIENSRRLMPEFLREFHEVLAMVQPVHGHLSKDLWKLAHAFLGHLSPPPCAKCANSPCLNLGGQSISCLDLFLETEQS